MENLPGTCAYPGCESQELMIKVEAEPSVWLCYCARHAREIYELGDDEAERRLFAHLACYRQKVQNQS